jgi:hypothetical protein
MGSVQAHIQSRQRALSQRGELTIYQEDPRLAVPQDEGDTLRIQPAIDRVQHRTCERDSKMGLQHRWRIRRKDGHRITGPHTHAYQRRREPVAALPRLQPGLPQGAMDDRDAIGVHVGRPLQESQRGERQEICRVALQAARIRRAGR